jgi:IMP dehydrogenase/GMP reductase
MITTKILPQEGFTFDDLLLVPRYSEVLPRSVSLRSNLTRGITPSSPERIEDKSSTESFGYSLPQCFLRHRSRMNRESPNGLL